MLDWKFEQSASSELASSAVASSRKKGALPADQAARPNDDDDEDLSLLAIELETVGVLAQTRHRRTVQLGKSCVQSQTALNPPLVLSYGRSYPCVRRLNLLGK